MNEIFHTVLMGNFVSAPNTSGLFNLSGYIFCDSVFSEDPRRLSRITKMTALKTDQQ